MTVTGADAIAAELSKAVTLLPPGLPSRNIAEPTTYLAVTLFITRISFDSLFKRCLRLRKFFFFKWALINTSKSVLLESFRLS